MNTFSPFMLRSLEMREVFDALEIKDLVTCVVVVDKLRQRLLFDGVGEGISDIGQSHYVSACAHLELAVQAFRMAALTAHEKGKDL